MRILLPALLGLALALRAGASEAPPERPRLRVQWQAWGPEAFAAARRQNRPILLWLHAPWSSASSTMAREAFADEKLAALLNERFIPVREDLDRRPDVGVRHQQAVQAAGGSAGWPLTVVLTPEGHVLYGGTFFTLEDDFLNERPGLWSVLSRAAEGWRTSRDELIRGAEALETELRKQGAPFKPALPPAGALERIARNMRAALDTEGGGFGPGVEGPKYPTPLALELALVFHARGGHAADLDVATRTLDGMLSGAIYDRLAGGFHRFARDRRWRLPRFEKLLAVDAEMLPVLIHAWQATEQETYAQAAQQTLDHWLNQLADRERGGFFHSIAADETYYTWTAGEAEAAIADPRTLALACNVLGISDLGDLPESAPYRNVLYRARGLKEAAESAGLGLAAAHERLLDAQASLLAARNRRPRPAVDRAIFVDANARMVSAFLLAAGAFGREDLRAFALKTLDRLLGEAVEPGAKGRGAAHVIETSGIASFSCLAADEAALALACQDAYAATGEPKYLRAAQAGLARLGERFLDRQDGAYLDRAAGVTGAPAALGRLGDAYKPYQDTPAPSANALAVFAGLRMTALTADPVFAAHARKTLEAFGPALEGLGGLASSLPLAADGALRGITLVLVEGPPGDPKVRALRAAAARCYAPHKLLVEAAGADLLAAWNLKPRGPAVHVLAAGQSALTVTDPAKLKEALDAACKRNEAAP